MRDAPIWDSELISHYNLSGPRYTSYPTAVQFTEDFDRQSYQSNAWRSAITAKPLSLYFHIPFCTHVCYYCACNKIVTKHKTRSTSYLKHLFREIELQSDSLISVSPLSKCILAEEHLPFLVMNSYRH